MISLALVFSLSFSTPTPTPADTAGGTSRAYPSAPTVPVSTGQTLSELPSETVDRRPLGDSLNDPLPGTTPALSLKIDSIFVLQHGALEGSKSLSSEDSLVYVWADWIRDNVLLNRTRRATIERRLLFQRGDTLDSLRLAETERLLRQERFLADAKVRTQRTSDGRNVATIETWDKWSTSVLTGLNRSGGELQWLLGLSESNLMGTGRTINGYYQSTVRRQSWNFGFADNAFIEQGQMLSMNFVKATDGNTYSLRFGEPLNSRYQAWAWMLEFDDAVADRYLWADVSTWQELRRDHPAEVPSDWAGGASGTAVGRLDAASINSFAAFGPLVTYPQTHTQKVRLWAQHVWGDDLRIATGPLLESQVDSIGAPTDSSSLPPSLLTDLRLDPAWSPARNGPPEIDDRRVGWMTTLRHDRWVRRKNFNNLKWVEDIPVGWLLEGNATHTVVSRGEDRDANWISADGRWSGLMDRTYISASSAWLRRVGGESDYPDRQALSWRAEVRQAAGANVQAIASASGDLIADAPVTSQLTLGEDMGLPGFPAHSFVGTSRNVFGSEVRWTPPLEAFTVAPALAAFAAAGRVGDEIRPLGSGQWHYGAGVGLRFGLTRSINGTVNHFSLSRPLGPEGGVWSETGSWMWSFGVKQSL